MATVGGFVVLAVDEDPAMRKLVRDMLEKAGLACVEAADGESGQCLAARTPVSAAVVSLYLPGMGGLELAWRLHRRWPALCIVGVSSYPDQWDAHGLGSLGVHKVLSVPFRDQELLRAICGGHAHAALRRGYGRRPSEPALPTQLLLLRRSDRGHRGVGARFYGGGED